MSLGNSANEHPDSVRGRVGGRMQIRITNQDEIETRMQNQCNINVVNQICKEVLARIVYLEL